jgi:hypothetical protein
MEFGVLMSTNRIHRLGETDQVLLSRRQVENTYLAQSALTLVHGKVIHERVGGVQLDLGPIRQRGSPVRLTRAFDGSLNQPEVGSTIVGSYEKPLTVVGYTVFDPRLAAVHEVELALGTVSVQESHLGRRMAGDVQKQISPAPGPLHVQEKRFVRLEVDQNVGTGTASERVPE